MDVGRPTFDQLAIFLAVIDEGSFNGAARRLGRAVSAISYGIASLEAQLGASVFAREGSRRPVLTEAGRAILGHARAVTDEVDALVAGMRAHNAGLEAELTLAVDVMVPLPVLAAVLGEFQLVFPTIEIRLHVEGLGAVAGLIADGRAQLGVAGPVIATNPDLHFQELAQVMLVPVAAPGHPLARMAAIAPGAARRYRQLVLSDRSALTAGQDFGVLGNRTWRLGDLAAKHALLLAGAGWGNMPEHMVADDLAAGRLVHLPLPEAARTAYPLSAGWRKDCPPGPARTWVIEAMAAALGPAGGAPA